MSVSVDGPRRPGRSARRVLVASGVTAAAAVLGYAGAKRAIRHARTRPDHERGEPMAERPGREHRVRSFDGTEQAVNAVGPEDAPTVVLINGFSGAFVTGAGLNDLLSDIAVIALWIALGVWGAVRGFRWDSSND